MCSASGANKSEKISGKQAEDTNPDMGRGSGVNRSEEISGNQAENSNPDMCSASDFDRSEKVSGEQAEKLVTQSHSSISFNPQSHSLTGGARYSAGKGDAQHTLPDSVTDLDEVIAENDQVLSSVDYC